LLRPLISLLYLLWKTGDDDCVAVGGMNDWQEKPEYPERTHHSDALFTTNPT
jgi:hypothetical protein